MSVLVACADLMTASRFGHPTEPVQTVRSAEQVLAAVDAGGIALIVLDLQGFAELAPRLREQSPELAIVGFAPHVQEELMDAARAHCTEVLPRGAVVKGFERLVDRHLAEHDGTMAP